MTRFVLISLFLISLLSLSSCSSNEKKVIIDTSLEKGLMEDLLKAFHVWHKEIELVFIYENPENIKKEILLKKGEVKTDFIFSENLSAIAEFLEPYASPSFKNINVHLGDEGLEKPRWSTISGYGLTFLVNKKHFEEKSLTLPESLFDLTKEDFKHEIALPNFEKTEIGYTFLSGVLFGMDPKNAFKILDDIRSNAVYFFLREDEGSSLVENGRYDIALVRDYLGKESKEGNPDLSLISLKEFQGLTLEMIGLVKKEKIKPAAKVFYDWILSDEAFLILEKHRLFINAQKYKGDAQRTLPLSDKEKLVYLQWKSLNRKLILNEWKMR